MPRPSQDYEKALISFRHGDKAKLKKFYPNTPYTAIVRSLVEQFVDALEEGNTPRLEFDPNRIQIK